VCVHEGVMDFFQEPAQGIVKGPKEFATGMRRGTHSMVKNTVSSALGTAQSLATGIRKVADVASMDEDEARRDAASRRRKPKNAVDGVAEGGKRLVEGIANGATGIVTKPIEGARKGGALGFFRGVARGVVGYRFSQHLHLS
jgi:vacuolar protein sorting-associated protein 13A/C